MSPARGGPRPPPAPRRPGTARPVAAAGVAAGVGATQRPPDTEADEAAGKGAIRQANERLILGAAERVFARAGFSGATMAAIADSAGLPKANLHYYFGNKAELYRAVLARTLHDWLAPLDALVPEADPRAALEAYIRAKMAFSRDRPDASRVFANELLHGAEELGALLAHRPARAGAPQGPRDRRLGGRRPPGAGGRPRTCSSPSGPPPRPMPTSRPRSVPCWAATAWAHGSMHGPPSMW